MTSFPSSAHRIHRPPFSAGRQGLRSAASLIMLCAMILFPAAARPGIIEYFRDRGEDLLDIMRLRFMVPDRAEGYGVKARATCLAQAGYVHFNGNAYGMDRRAIGHNLERRTEGGISVLYFSRTIMLYQGGNQYLDPESRWNQTQPRGVVRNSPGWDDMRYHPDSIGAEAELGAFGLDAGIYPLEGIDFALGWLTFDIYRDDRTYVDSLPAFTPKPLEEPPLPGGEAGAKAAASGAPSPASKPSSPPPSSPPAAVPPAEKSPEQATLGSDRVTPADLKAPSADANLQTPIAPAAPAPPEAPADKAPAGASPAPAPPAPDSSAPPAPAPPAPDSSTAPSAPAAP